MVTRREARRWRRGASLGDSDAGRSDDDAARDEVMVARREARRRRPGARPGDDEAARGDAMMTGLEARRW